MAKTFAAHLADVRFATTDEACFAATRAIEVKWHTNARKVTLMHYQNGRADDAAYWSQKMEEWAVFYREALEIWADRAKMLSSDRLIEVLGAAA